MIEFSLCFLVFLGTMLGFAQMGMAVWVKSTLHHAAREGVRYAITGATEGELGHVASIRNAVVHCAGGLIDPETANTSVDVKFYDKNAALTSSNAGGNTVVVRIQDYPVPTLAPAILAFVPDGLKVSVSAVDRLEPYSSAPAL